MIHERNRHTDRQTDGHTPHADRPRLCIASRSNEMHKLSKVKTISTSCAARWPPQYAPAPADRRPISGQFVVRGQERHTAYVHAKFEDRSRNIEGVPKFRNWVTYPRPRQLRGQFVVRGQELPTAYVRTKFEGRSFIRLRNIGTFRCGALIDPVTLTFDLCS